MKKLYGFILLLLLLFASCSSAPKRPVEIFAIQSMAETNITLANKEADQGNYSEALTLLNEAWRLAVASDRPALRIRVNLAQANSLYALGQTAEAERLWQNVEQEANSAGESLFASASRIYRARSMLMSGAISPELTLALTLNEQDRLKKDRLFTALNWTVKGMAEKELGRYADAEKSVMNALAIHEKDRYLEQAAYDWYLIASIRSVAGNYREALEALDSALSFDRRAENTFGLAMNWAAKGEVYRNMGDEDSAAHAWRRSAEIFRVIDRQAQAREMERRILQGRRQGGIRRTRDADRQEDDVRRTRDTDRQEEDARRARDTDN